MVPNSYGLYKTEFTDTVVLQHLCVGESPTEARSGDQHF